MLQLLCRTSHAAEKAGICGRKPLTPHRDGGFSAENGKKHQLFRFGMYASTDKIRANSSAALYGTPEKDAAIAPKAGKALAGHVNQTSHRVGNGNGVFVDA